MFSAGQKNNIASIKPHALSGKFISPNEVLSFSVWHSQEFRGLRIQPECYIISPSPVSSHHYGPMSRVNCLLSSCYGNVSVDWVQWKILNPRLLQIRTFSLYIYIRRNSNVCGWKLKTFIDNFIFINKHFKLETTSSFLAPNIFPWNNASFNMIIRIMIQRCPLSLWNIMFNIFKFTSYCGMSGREAGSCLIILHLFYQLTRSDK